MRNNQGPYEVLQAKILHNERKLDAGNSSAHILWAINHLKHGQQKEEGKTGASRRGNTSSSSDDLGFGLKNEVADHVSCM